MGNLESLSFDNSYARLPPAFYSRLQPTPLRGSYLASFNPSAARLLDLDPAEAQRPEILAYLEGSRPLPGSEPIAMLYSGHQFGHYVPQLGDGRAILLGEVVNARGERWDLHLKGSGLTPYSRDGDGRAVLRSCIREYLGGEAMHGLGIPTTRALCLIASREPVHRETIETGAQLLRLAPSHLRFGSFEVFFYRGQHGHLCSLADYLIRHHYPHLEAQDAPYLELLREVVRRTAGLIAQWQLVGFNHGVMNTDNMSVLGITLDYGPFAFLDDYQPDFVCNHSDRFGRYGFDRQAKIGLWNLSCFAQSLLPLLDTEDGDGAAAQAMAVLGEYEPELARQYRNGMRAKLGLREPRDNDHGLAERLLALMARDRVDYSRCFRWLGDFSARWQGPAARVRSLFADRSAFDVWAADYRSRLLAESSNDQERRERMNAVNPKFVLRNAHAQRAIALAEQGDFSEVEHLLALLRDPYHEQPEWERYAEPPPECERHLILSCSS